MPLGGLVTAAVIGGGSAYLSSRAKNNQAKDQAKVYNDWLKNYQQTGQGLYNQAQAGGWNPFGDKTSTSQSQGSTTGGSSTNYSNKPVITGEYAPLDAMMRNIMTGRLSGGSSLPQGYAENAIRGINQSYEGTDQAARNMAARRGLSGEQTYAIASPGARARAGDIADLRGSLPLLERQMQNEDIGITQGLQSAFGTGQQGRSNTSSFSNTLNSGTQTNPFNAGDLSALMSVLAPPSPQQSTQTGISPVGSGLSSLGSLLGYYASQQAQGGVGMPSNIQGLNTAGSYQF